MNEKEGNERNDKNDSNDENDLDDSKYRGATELLWKIFWNSFYLILLPVSLSVIIALIVNRS